MKQSVLNMENPYKDRFKKLSHRFFKDISDLDDKLYSDIFIGYILAPVITGIKPSSTITITSSKKKIYDFWLEHKKDFLDKYKLKSFILKEKNDSVIELIYDEKNLIEHLSIGKNHNLLKQFGYDDDFQLKKYLICLKQRIKYNEFPHESGIFMGIPSEDVEGFLNKNECVYIGHWKVYTETYNHKNIFMLYDVSKDVYMRNYLDKRNLSIKNIYCDNKRKLYQQCG